MRGLYSKTGLPRRFAQFDRRAFAFRGFGFNEAQLNAQSQGVAF